MERSRLNIKVRQPLASLVIRGTAHPTYWSEMIPLIQEEVNVKSVVFEQGEMGVVLDAVLTPELIREGQVREFTRAVQDLRKKEGLTPGQQVTLVVSADDAAKQLIEEARGYVMHVAGLSNLVFEELHGDEVMNDLVLEGGVAAQLAIRK